MSCVVRGFREDCAAHAARIGFDLAEMPRTVAAPSAEPETGTPIDVLDAVQRRVLWLAMSMVHHANKVRATDSGVKVGGHQASSASIVSIMTALYFEHLRAPDRVSVKPHAAPVLHAINYLLGRLDESYLTTLREFGGLQSYPSRAKDPDPVDFSTGSVGIGATATIWSALAHRYVAGHFEVPRGGRQVALVGDAELDEGAVWEALVDPMVARLGEVLWIVDVNRQSLDRVVPEIAAGRIGAMFEAAGWQTITVKYGRRLRALFERRGGEALRGRIDAMPNEEYQRLLRSPSAELRERLPGDGRGRREVERIVRELDDAELAGALRDLGGHDLAELLDAFRARRRRQRPPDGDLRVHDQGVGAADGGAPGQPLGAALRRAVARAGGRARRRRRATRGRASPRARPRQELCDGAAGRLARERIAVREPPAVPAELGARTRAAPNRRSRAFGRFFMDLAHAAPDVATHVVTRQPGRRVLDEPRRLDQPRRASGTWASGSTGSPTTRTRSCAGASPSTASTSSSASPRATSSACSASSARRGRATASRCLPIGTLYDPFVNRALEPWSFGIYAGGQSILVGTPSGVTLAPEGGAHQSIITPSVGLEQPRCIAWEPAFGQDLEWTLLHALSQLGREDGGSSYLRLSTRPVDQSLAAPPDDPAAREARRAQVLAGGYRLREAPAPPAVTLAAMGAVMPEALAAAERADGGRRERRRPVPHLGRPSVPRAAGAAGSGRRATTAILDELFPPARAAPLVTVLDGHPHTLAVPRGGRRQPDRAASACRTSASRATSQDLYRHFGIDAETIVGAALDLIG